VQRPGRQARPEAALGAEAEEKREEREKKEPEQRRGPEGTRSHSFSLQRERTKETTVLARSGGMSRGFKSFSVFPVAS